MDVDSCESLLAWVRRCLVTWFVKTYTCSVYFHEWLNSRLDVVSQNSREMTFCTVLSTYLRLSLKHSDPVVTQPSSFGRFTSSALLAPVMFFTSRVMLVE